MTHLRMNLHTHTYRCKHAKGDVGDYCRHAVEAGLKTLGISDHTALPDDRWQGERMPYADLPAYMESITEAQKDYPQLRVLRSVECEFDNVYQSFYRDEMLGTYNCDYLIGAVHYFPQQGQWLSPFRDMNKSQAMTNFVDYFIDSMASGLFAFMAHPDNFGASLSIIDKQVQSLTRVMCEAAVDLDMIWEINGYGFRKTKVRTPQAYRRPYPLRAFWDIVAEYPIRVIINSDAHRPQDVAANLDDAAQMARQRGLEIVGLKEILDRG